ncbi:alpha/beta fold hydrolase [Streptosporangium sp. NPDC002721]|uniref:alpha/beta fold hydrolase n=1 Tax=Streptosporangium sp. NPDC002721 TaxID=3366188 RepID=UPI0036AED535
MTRPLLHRRGGGEGPTVLFVHGTMDRSASFSRVVARLEGWTAAGYDRRGWGGSQALAIPDTRLADHVADLVALAARLPRPVLAGHSYGGLVALCAAAERPDLVDAVVAYEPPVPWLPWWPALAPWERLVLKSDSPVTAATLLHRAVAGGPPTPATRSAIEAAGPALLREMADPTLDHEFFDPAALAVPVVTASGSRSLQHHRDTARHLADLIPTADHHEIDDTAHLAHVTHPAAFADLIRQAAAMAPSLPWTSRSRPPGKETATSHHL